MSGLMLANVAEPAFARHETFHPRFGWLRKAVSQAGDGTVFADAEATVKLGVGKNMVNAIRYWGLAYKVLEQRPNPANSRLALVMPSAFGEALLGDDGWDPYLEDPASLWLLHWKLLESRCTAPTWWVAFNDFTALQFTEAQLTSHIMQLTAAAGWPTVVEASVKKDVDCMIRTYTVRHHGRQAIDDVLDCPFRELGLMESAIGDEGRAWRFVVGDKLTLPDDLVAYAALEFAKGASEDARSISIARLAHDPGSPGSAFRLTETGLFDALGRFSETHPDLAVAEPAGLRQLLFEKDPGAISADILKAYYSASATEEVKSA
ncbi:DUF4007 family protein [Kribbella sp. NPDC051620]|uniref:DUF4007 family protein n=1 Tax=Kribbella sp. NPDC051620 TaxID=3364120 RepID=UPI0037BB8934